MTFASELDDPTREVLQKFVNPEFMAADAICRTAAGDRPVDVYVAGFPCQPFSAIGAREGFNDPRERYKVFFRLIKYIKTAKPSVFVLENVRGVLDPRHEAPRSQAQKS